MRNRGIWLAAIALAIAGAGSAVGQAIQALDTGLGGANMITGMVLSPSGQRLQGRVAVKLRTMTRGDRVTVTDDAGNFGFRGLPNGDYSIVIDNEKDFESYTQNANVFQMRGTPGQNIFLSIRLKPKPGTIPKAAIINAELANVPASSLAYYKKAAELSTAGDHKGAIEQLKLAVADHPKFALAYNDMGVHYLKLNDMGRADDAFKTAINIDGTYYPALLNHGIILYNIKKYGDAETIFRDVIKARSDSAVGHYFLGQSLAYLGKFPEAEKELLEGVSLGGPSMAEALKESHRLLAIIYGSRGDTKKAASALETYLKLAPNAPDAEQLRETLKRLKG